MGTPVCAQEASLDEGKWAPWVEFGGFYGSRDTSRGEAVLWVPFAQGHSSLLFGEARGKLFEDDMREGNFALGYRQMTPGGWNLGVWGGYDIRESQYGNAFHQLAGGVEALSDRWDFRANAYLPLNDSENLFRASSVLTSGPALEFTGSTIGLVTTTTATTASQDELALWGLDAEIGAKLYGTPLDLPGPRHELRVYAGAYHFDHSDLPESVTGPRLRAEWRVDEAIDRWEGSRLTFEGEYSHDDLRDDRFEVGARLRLPFGSEGRSAYAARSLSAQERRMADGLERDTDIVTETRTTSSSTTSSVAEAVEDAETGVRFDRVATVGAAGDLTSVSAAAGANSLIIADGSAGEIIGAQTLQGAQTLMGGGSTIEVRGVTSGTVLAFAAPGTRPTLRPTGSSSSVLSLSGSDTHIAGVDIVGNGSAESQIVFGIRLADGEGNILVSDVAVSALSGAGVRTGDNSFDVTVQNSSFTDIGKQNSNTYSAILVRYNARNVNLSNLEFDGVFRAIMFSDGSDGTLTNARIHGADGAAYALSTGFGATVAFSNVSVSGAFDDSVSFLGGQIITIGFSSTVTGTGNTIEPGTTYSNSFCDGSGWSGSFEFNGTTYTAANC